MLDVESEKSNIKSLAKPVLEEMESEQKGEGLVQLEQKEKHAKKLESQQEEIKSVREESNIKYHALREQLKNV